MSSLSFSSDLVREVHARARVAICLSRVLLDGLQKKERASDRAKWSNYVHSYISDTQGVNTTPFCAGAQALVPEHQLWTVTYSTAEILVWELEETLSSHKRPASAVS